MTMQGTIQNLNEFNQTFRATISNEGAQQFKTLLEVLTKFTEEPIYFYIDEDGLAFQAHRAYSLRLLRLPSTLTVS